MTKAMRTAVATVLFGVLFGVPSASAQSQTSASQNSGPHEGVGVQLIGGPLFATLTEAKDFSTKTRAGYLVGLGIGGNRGGVIGIEGDILYGEKGAKINGTSFDVKVVHVPIMLKANIGSGSVNGPSLFVTGGGFFDWQFASNNIPNLTNDTKGYEVGYVLGGGIEILRFSLQGRYIRGLKEIDRKFAISAADDSNTQAFAVLFGFRLN
jgi:hypothetical protein